MYGIIDKEFDSLLGLINIKLANKKDLLGLWGLCINMFGDILAISNGDAFLVLIYIRVLSLFFRDDNTYKTAKYFEIADVLFFSVSALFRY